MPLLTDERPVEDPVTPTRLTAVESCPSKSRMANSPVDLDPLIDAIIAKGRASRRDPRGRWWIPALSGGLVWAAFFPLNWGFLAWVALVPLLIVCRSPTRFRGLYPGVFLGGLLFWAPALQWMRLGHPSMYVAWSALAIYCAGYFPLFVSLTRVALQRFKIPLALTAPVVWTGLELLRAWLITGFPWYFLGHTQHRWTNLVQIADLFGAYGVSFVVVAVNAGLASLISPERIVRWMTPHEPPPQAVAGPQRTLIWAVAFPAVLVLTATGYGNWRRGNAPFPAGPRVALIQGNFTSEVKHDPERARAIFDTHRLLTAIAVPFQPDLIVWPESMFRFPLLEYTPGMTDEQLEGVHPDLKASDWHDQRVRQALGNLADEANAALVIGLDVVTAVPPVGDQPSPENPPHGTVRAANSAVFCEPGRGLVGRYDKMHLVPFGEYNPCAALFANLLTAMGLPASSIDLAPGQGFRAFQQKDYSYVPIICFEDTVPHFVRDAVQAAQAETGRPVSCLVNLTNDGWFHGSSELDQHLITASFRCIELRIPMVRAVNTGVSAVIDGDGRIREPEPHNMIQVDERDHPHEAQMIDPQTGRFTRQKNLTLVADVPLDTRKSLYFLYGDWFAAGCASCCVLLAVAGLWPGKNRAEIPNVA